MPKLRPKTGERRATNQPLNIDHLPPSAHDAILTLRNKLGKTWQEIEAISALKLTEKRAKALRDGEWIDPLRGFVDWENLPLHVLKRFPDMRLPHTTLHRWYDLRVAQVRESTLDNSARARQLAESFAESNMKNADEAVINAARDIFMGVLAEDGSAAGKQRAASKLVALGELMQMARANDIKARKVAVDERKIAELEKESALRRAKLEREAESVGKKLKKGTLTQKDLDGLVERTFGIAPKRSTKAA